MRAAPQGLSYKQDGRNWVGYKVQLLTFMSVNTQHPKQINKRAPKIINQKLSLCWSHQEFTAKTLADIRNLKKRLWLVYIYILAEFCLLRCVLNQLNELVRLRLRSPEGS